MSSNLQSWRPKPQKKRRWHVLKFICFVFKWFFNILASFLFNLVKHSVMETYLPDFAQAPSLCHVSHVLAPCGRKRWTLSVGVAVRAAGQQDCGWWWGGPRLGGGAQRLLALPPPQGELQRIAGPKPIGNAKLRACSRPHSVFQCLWWSRDGRDLCKCCTIPNKLFLKEGTLWAHYGNIIRSWWDRDSGSIGDRPFSTG